MTPVVGSLMAVNAVVGLLTATVFTLPAFRELVEFHPAFALARPWTLLTYLVVYPGLMSVGANLLLLMLFGPPVEQRLGGRAFFFYYLLCGVGTALFGLGLTSLLPVPPLVGSGGAVLGIALGFAVLWPEAYLNLEPLSIRPRVRLLVATLAGVVMFLSFLLPDGNALLAQLGGFVVGYLFFRFKMVRVRRVEPPRTPVLARPVRTAVSVPHSGSAEPLRSARPQESPRERYTAEELDRVLDKISASGIESLTPEERRFLQQISARKRKDAS
jgi:membrane associated rhomboid family serine protease